MIIKKGTQVLEFATVGGDSIVEEANSERGKAFIAALEKICGSPTLDLYEGSPEPDSITSSLYRAPRDLELVEE